MNNLSKGSVHACTHPPSAFREKNSKIVHVLTTREADTIDTIVLANIEVVMENCAHCGIVLCWYKDPYVYMHYITYRNYLANLQQINQHAYHNSYMSISQIYIMHNFCVCKKLYQIKASYLPDLISIGSLSFFSASFFRGSFSNSTAPAHVQQPQVPIRAQ